ncbi:MAG TPA: CHAD domain-containing protein [Bacteroidota bacterium]|nr:CHAD domain-containing protein [Bacteroidota bacterium]
MKTRQPERAAPLPADIPGFLLRALEGRWHRFAAELAQSRRRCTEPGIHDLRVAARRLLAVLDLAGAVLPGEFAPRARRLLRKTLRSFSPLRDCHVRILTLRAYTRRYTVARPLLREARAQERTLVREAARMIARFDAPLLEREVAAIARAFTALEGAAARAAGDVLAGAAAKKYLRVASRRRKITGANSRSIHRLRVAFKEYRYTVEALMPLYPSVDRSRLRAMSALQDSMGAIQDVEVLIDVVARFALKRGARYPASVLNFQRHLAGRRGTLVEAFLLEVDAVAGFWPPGRGPEEAPR